MKKKHIILIIIAVIALFLITLGTTMIALDAQKSENAEKRETSKYIEEQTITCIREQGHDDVSETEIAYLQKGVLITKQEIDEWSKSGPSERTCKYYTSKNEGLHTKKGVVSNVDCSETRGRFTATYTIAEIEKEDMGLKEFNYILENDIFDYRSWIRYMQENNYKCTRS